MDWVERPMCLAKNVRRRLGLRSAELHADGNTQSYETSQHPPPSVLLRISSDLPVRRRISILLMVLSATLFGKLSTRTSRNKQSNKAFTFDLIAVSLFELVTA